MVMSAGSQRSAEAIASLGSSGSSNTSDVQEVVAEFQTLLASRLASGSAAAELGADALTRRLVGYLSVTPALQLARALAISWLITACRLGSVARAAYKSFRA